MGRIAILCLAFFLFGIVVGRFLLAPQEELGSPKGRLVVKSAEVEKKGPAQKPRREKARSPKCGRTNRLAKAGKNLNA